MHIRPFVVCMYVLISKRNVSSCHFRGEICPVVSGQRSPEVQIQSAGILVRASVDWSRHFITLARSWLYQAGWQGVILRDKYFYLFESSNKLVESWIILP